jgi:amino acid transporter
MVWNTPLKWGAIGGLVVVIISFIIYFISPTSFASSMLAMVFLLIAMFFMIWGGLAFRKENNNEISYLNALFAVLIIAAVLSLISTMFSYVLTSFIDPELPELIKQKAIENTQAMMEKFNTPDDKIEEVIDQMKEQDFNFGIVEYGKRFLWGMLMYAVMGALIALFIKRNPDKIEAEKE